MQPGWHEAGAVPSAVPSIIRSCHAHSGFKPASLGGHGNVGATLLLHVYKKQWEMSFKEPINSQEEYAKPWQSSQGCECVHSPPRCENQVLHQKQSRKHATTKKAPENSWEAGPHLLSPLQNYIFFNSRKGSVFRVRFQRAERRFAQQRTCMGVVTSLKIHRLPEN